ncbi:hypothetical protein C5467_21770 [Photorhabdus khanii subsp. guanajuatensis]|uniref:Uncharacterized protein n=1 Tax=Photorhabdus khanii subsp. guanajuatensis TaxID=2100166 RepID=A0A4R4IX06_9GAMM|nr:hypothetical protein C5467_21770 [Photorhabdus khanii subsp. guanajuatensis]
MGKPTARSADNSAGKGGRKKRMPDCNGPDKSLNVTQRESVAHFRLVSLCKRVFRTLSMR